jgi:hypothetical protein
MAGSTAEWERYSRWNAAIASVVFSRKAAGKPTYLDLEDEVLEAIGDAAEPDAGDPAATLIEVTKGTLALRSGAAPVLRGHLRRLGSWHDGSMLDPPPTLGLLALLSLVAESMHAGDGMKPHNFWGRFEELLELDGHQLDWFRSAYRDKTEGVAVSTQLWDSLNDWLEMLEGNRGLPTAVALGHEHIGYPLSQALVRQTDRERFGDMFALNSLPPRGSLPPFDMETLIAEWMARRPCPASNTLEKLWGSSAEARERITDLACATLEVWDGSSAIGSNALPAKSPVDLVRVRAALRSFPSEKLDISLVIPARSVESVETVEVRDSSDECLGVLELVPAASGYLQLADPEAIDVSSLLGGEVHLRRPNQSQPMRRRPRRVVPMRHEALLQAFVECERVQLGEDSLLLVREVITPMADKVLAAVARPGFTRIKQLPGLPEGWTAYTNVQVLSSIPVEMRSRIPVDLNVLQPIASSQVVLQGGLRLPGNITKWSSWRPPELRATAEAGAELSASMTCTRVMVNPAPVDRSARGSEVLIWDLVEEDLPDGDYEITIKDGASVMRTEVLRLRSADSPALVIEADSAPIAHDPAGVGFGLLTRRSKGEGSFQGVPPDARDLVGAAPPLVPPWYEARRNGTKTSTPRTQLRIPAPDDKSCMVTGAHLMSIETVTVGGSTVEGVCRYCGLVKRYPATRGKRKSTKTAKKGATAPKVDVSLLPPVESTESIDWAAAFDAVCHVGSGPVSALDRVASQMEATNLFGDAFERQLEVLGHIEVERDQTTLKPANWTVVDPCIVGLADGAATICGFVSDGMMVAIEDGVWAFGGSVERKASGDAPPVIRITGLSAGQLSELADVIAEASRRPARFIPDAAIRLGAALPPLSEARMGLPTTSAINGRSYEAWDPTVARFVPVDDAGSSGAFRVTTFTRTYIYRTTADLGSMRATLGDARVVKYLAAADCGRSLIGYDGEAQVLYVPLGADLPGLYGRAAVLASGYPPAANPEERILEYRGVPAALAAHLNHLLMT